VRRAVNLSGAPGPATYLAPLVPPVERVPVGGGFVGGGTAGLGADVDVGACGILDCYYCSFRLASNRDNRVSTDRLRIFVNQLDQSTTRREA
jgi:hypothetical protein